MSSSSADNQPLNLMFRFEEPRPIVVLITYLHPCLGLFVGADITPSVRDTRSTLIEPLLSPETVPLISGLSPPFHAEQLISSLPDL